MAFSAVGDLLRIGAAHLLHRFRPDLNRGVGVEHVALGIDVLRLELLHHVGRRLHQARVGRERHHGAGSGIAGDLPELIGHQRIAADQGRLHPLLFRLADDQPGLGVVAADIDHGDAGLLQAADQRRIVLLARRIGRCQRFLAAGGMQRLRGLVRQSFAVGGVVVQDRDLLALEVFGQIVAGDLALIVVAAADAERVPASFIGVFRIGRGGGDLQDAFLGIDLARGDRAAGAEMSGDQLVALGSELVGDRHRLLRVTGVVAHVEHELLAQHAARIVDVGHGLFGARFSSAGRRRRIRR